MGTRIQYSIAFRKKVLEEIQSGKWGSGHEAAQAYGMKDGSVYRWMDKYGYGHLKGKVVKVVTPEEKDQVAVLKAEIKKLKGLLLDEVIAHRLDEATMILACRDLGLTPEQLQKKWSGLVRLASERYREANPHARGIQKALCERLGYSRQALYKERKSRARKAVDEGLVITLVDAQRTVHPQIGGRHLSESLKAEGCIRALEMAAAKAPRGAVVIVHSDRGCQFAGREFRALLGRLGWVSSMTEERHCYENGAAERVNGILKQEYCIDAGFRDFAEAEGAVRQAIHSYNELRPHLSLGMMTPREARLDQWTALANVRKSEAEAKMVHARRMAKVKKAREQTKGAA